MHTFALANQRNGSLAQLNRASDYGSEGCRFESCRSHKESVTESSVTLSFFMPVQTREVEDRTSAKRQVERATEILPLPSPNLNRLLFQYKNNSGDSM